MLRSASSLLVLALTPALGLAQSTWYVDVNGTPPGTGTQLDPYTSLQFAIAQPSTLSGDSVLVLPGTYLEQIDFLGKDLVVRSTAGAANTILDAGASGRVVTFQGGESAAAVLDGFTVRNGRVASSPPSSMGGGIGCFGASPTLTNLIVRNNLAYRGGGVYLSASTATLTACEVRANGPLPSCCDFAIGAGIHATCDSSPVVTDCTIAQNVDALEGGGVWGAGLYLGCLIDDNRGFRGANVNGGGCDPELRDCVLEDGFTFVQTDGGPGGGVHGPARLFDCTLRNNRAYLDGGGAFNATLTRCTLEQNTAFNVNSIGGKGGGATASTLVECTVVGNRAYGQNAVFAGSRGGGIFGGSATDCVLRENLALNGDGGGAANATLVRCEVVDNEATQTDVGTPSGGGGLADCIAERTLVWRNRAGRGGGVSNGSLTNCVVYRNSALVSNGGVEAGDFAHSGNATLRNSVVWENDAPQLLATNGTISATYCDVQGGFAGTGNFDADPLFWLPQTADVHLKAGSPCIDAGDPTSPPDPDSSVSDVGIHPFDAGFCGLPRSFCEAKVNSQGCLPAIGSSGTPSLSGPDDFVVTATLVRNAKIGTLFTSASPAALPAFGATLCAQPPVVRLASQGSGGSPGNVQDCSGSYAFALTQQRMQQLGLGWGSTRYFQILYRDPPHPDGTGVGLTDGLEATICP